MDLLETSTWVSSFETNQYILVEQNVACVFVKPVKLCTVSSCYLTLTAKGGCDPNITFDRDAASQLTSVLADYTSGLSYAS